MSVQNTIVLVNWNSWADTIECLESIFQMEGQSFSVIVVDNGSSDGSARNIIKWAEGIIERTPQHGSIFSTVVPFPCKKPVSWACCTVNEALRAERGLGEKSLLIINSEKNLGFAGANNIGIRASLQHGEVERVWLLNNDTVVDPKALDSIVRRMCSDERCGMCGSTLLFFDEPERIQAMGGGRYLPFLGLSWHMGFRKKFTNRLDFSHAERAMNYVVGASLCVSRRFVEEIGPMNESYFLFFEEVDWAVRGGSRFRLGYAPDSLVYHKVGRSIGTSSNPLKKSSLCDYYNLRNRIIFSKIHAPWALPGVYAVMCFGIFLRLALGQWSRALMTLKIICGCGHNVEHSAKI